MGTPSPQILTCLGTALLVLCSSCATLLSRNQYTVPVRSEPTGAQYRITDLKGNTIREGTTPDMVRLKAHGGYFKRGVYRVDLTMPEHEPAHTYLTARVDGWYWPNLVIFPLLGMLIVDPISGSMYTLRKQMVYELLPLR
jgi:hypothetical protein